MQDAQTCFVPEGTGGEVFVSVVCDGAGSAVFGGQGASLVCRSIRQAVSRHFASTARLPTDAELLSWVDSARDRIFAVAQRRSLTPRDFASTLVWAIAGPSETIVVHVGDGCVVVNDAREGQWTAASWPDHGEYASMTRFVTDDPQSEARISRRANAVCSIVLFTDGLERLALDFSAMQPFSGFFDGICHPLFRSQSVGQDDVLRAHLKDFLNSSAVNARTDDDKTLVIAARI